MAKFTPQYDYEWVAAVGTALFQELTPGITV